MNSEKFKGIRKSLRLTQRDLAKKIGLGEDQVRDIENGKIKPSRSAVRALEHYESVCDMRGLISVIRARRFEKKIGLIEFCDSMGILYEEWKKLEDF